MLCHTCGTENADNATSCAKCGAPLGGAAAAGGGAKAAGAAAALESVVPSRSIKAGEVEFVSQPAATAAKAQPETGEPSSPKAQSTAPTSSGQSTGAGPAPAAAADAASGASASTRRSKTAPIVVGVVVAAIAIALVFWFAAGRQMVEDYQHDQTVGSYAGTWILTEGDNEALSRDAIDELRGRGLTCILSLNEDGTGSITLFGSSETQLEWSVADDGTVGGTVTDSGDFTLDKTDTGIKLVDSTGTEMFYERSE